MSLSIITPENLAVLRDHASASPAGAFVEVGVYRGGSARVLYEIAVSQGRSLYLFDTFAGHPTPGEHDAPEHPAGRYADCADPHALRLAMPNARVVVGRFPDSLPPLPPVAFAHVDVDLYESTRDSIDALRPLMAPGGVIYCDDYGVPECPGATRAMRECFGAAVEELPNGKALARVR